MGRSVEAKYEFVSFDVIREISSLSTVMYEGLFLILITGPGNFAVCLYSVI